MFDSDFAMGLQRVLVIAPILLFSLSFHEMAHAWVANRLGDPTARHLGRVTMDPRKHIDLFGTIIIPIVAIFLSGISLIGWAKPVPVNPNNFDNWRRDDTIVALAGPASNIILAFVFSLVFFILASMNLVGFPPNPTLDMMFSDYRVEAFLYYGMITNIALAVFNMMPVPPLDGSHILTNYLPDKFAEPLRQLGFMGILVLIVLLNIPAFRSLYGGLLSFFLAPFNLFFYA